MPSPTLTHFAQRAALPLLLAAFVVLGGIYAVVTPLFEASDELWHYPMVKRLADGAGLPVQDPANVGPWRQEGSQPPLYYYAAALATFWIDTSDVDEVRWLNPHVDNGVITADGNINLAIHTAAEDYPWRGTALAVRLIRFLSVLMSAGTVYFTYRLAQEALPGSRGLALAAACVVAFTPMFLFISGAVNNDNLASLLSAAVLWLLVRLAVMPPSQSSTATPPHSPPAPRPTLHASPSRLALLFTGSFFIVHCALGVLLGLAALTKESTLGLFPLAAAVLAHNSYRQWRGSPPATRPTPPAAALQVLFRLAATGLLVFGLAALIAGWWYWRNYVLYGDFLGLNVFIQILGQRAAPASLGQLWSERAGFMQSYWGLFGGVNVPMPAWVYLVLNTLSVLAAVGLVVFFVRRFLVDRFSLQAWLPTLLTVGWVAAVVASLIRWATTTWSSQGRLVFSANSAIATLFVAGLAALLPRRAQPYFFGALALFLFGISAAAPFAWIAPAYAPPPALTQAQQAAIQHPLDADFAGRMRLLGYDLESNAVQPGGALAVTLYWQAGLAADRDWSVFVHLLDENEIVVAQRDTYPGLGLLPTRRLAQGRTLADRYVVEVPATTYAPSAARLVVGLYDYQTGERLPVSNAEGTPDTLTLAPVTIAPNPGPVPNPLALNFHDLIELAGYKLDRRIAQPGETLHLTLYWRGQGPIAENYSVFTHVRGEGESIWAQMDGWPQGGAAPTSTWTPGELVEDNYDLTLKPDTPPGVYDIEIGLYDANGDRLQLITPDGRLADNFAYLSKVRVVVP